MSEQIDPNFWDNSEYVYWCLADAPRTNAYRKSIEAVVKPGDTVVDLGAGSGVLGFTAAQCGAEAVYLVELDPILAEGLRKSKRHNRFGERVHILQEDALTVGFDRKIDVVICEMISTALVSEFQGPVVNHIHPFCHPNTRFVPGGSQCFADLVYKLQPIPGMALAVVSYDYGEAHPHDTDSTAMSDAVAYRRFNFAEPVDQKVDEAFELTIHGEGRVNGLRLQGETSLTGFGEFGFSAAYSMPMILPIAETTVRPGQVFRVSLSYTLGKGIAGLHYEVRDEVSFRGR